MNNKHLLLLACLSAGLHALRCVAQDHGAVDTKPQPGVVPAVEFVCDVKPIFQRSCVRCHGSEKQKGDYRLDVRKSALTGGESYAPNIVSGKSAESPLIRFVSGADDLVMPPEGDRLSADDVKLLRRWIDEGAKWPDEAAGTIVEKSDLWSIKPLIRPAVPNVVTDESDAVPSPIDAFIRAKLTEIGLRPAPEADRRTLIRRVYFDLIGLPPTPDEVEAFVADANPRAYERLVDRLLDSPRYGERWARHWLDAAHFAETHGHDQDRIRENAWPYRDYLIQSLNADKPYGRFIQEQVAGDALFPDDPQATVALGFLAAGPWDESSLRDIREDTLDRQVARYLDRDDMIATVINNVSSLTIQCARCHDHKFDPISQADYYSLQAVFAGVERANRRYEADPAVHQRRLVLLQRKAALQQRSPEVVAALSSEQFQKQIATWERQLGSQAIVWKVVEPESMTSTDGSTLTKLPDNSVLSGGTRPEKDTVTIIAAVRLAKVTAIRFEVLTDDSLPHRGPGRQDNGNLHLSEFEVFLNSSDSPLMLINPASDFDQQDWGVAKSIDKIESTAWGIYPKVGQSHTAVFELRDAAVGTTNAADATAPLKLRFVLKQRHGGGHLIGRTRLSVTDAAPPVRVDVLPEAITTVLAIPIANRSETQRLELALFQQLGEVERELSLLPKPSLVYAAAADFEPDGSLRPPPGPRPIHVLHRGDIKQPRDEAAPGALSALRDLPARFELDAATNEAARRVALARWLTDSQSPVTWRSIVNRVWHHHFGRGLVATVNDFGHMGEKPSHSELLDWLAVEFRDGGQSLKTLHRMIVSTATYRQASTRANAALAANAAPVPSPPSSGERVRVRGPLSDVAASSDKKEEQKPPYPNSLLKNDVEHVFNVLIPEEYGHVENVPHVFQQTANPLPAEPGRGDKTGDANIVDPDNRYLSHMNRTRLDAECVRDAVLAISGRLDLRMGGPSDRQFDLQPGIHVTPKVDYAKFNLDSDLGRRRSIYRFLFRTLPDPFMTTLDCPSGDQITASRTNSVTVQQALALWNDAFITRHCEHIAARLESLGDSTDARVTLAVEFILNRPPTPGETRDLNEYAAKHSLANLCRLLLNTNEFLFVN